MQNSTIFTIFLIAMSLDCNIKIEIKTNIDIKTNMYDFPIEKNQLFYVILLLLLFTWNSEQQRQQFKKKNL